jgi:Fe(3+) dicitrate transport protein
MKIQLSAIAFATAFSLHAQTDSIRNIQAVEVQIKSKKSLPLAGFLPEVNGLFLAGGRKTSLIRPDNRFADLTSNQSRQLFAKVAGISIWENDGSGVQTSIASRGLSPNRSWEFNVRQDGADISSDPFGYPEAYYTPPPEAIEKIELTRGAASLAFGPQFGGALNYCLKKARAGAPLRFSSTQTLGSFGTFNSFQSFSGSAGKFFWTTWLHHRNARGWRENSRYFTRSGFLSLGYAFRQNLMLEINTTISNMEGQQPGGIADSNLRINASASRRPRNWLATPWNLASISLRHEVTENWKYEVLLFGNLSERNSVGFVNPLTIADTINASTNAYNPRQLDRDYYQSLGMEFRHLIHWGFGGKTHVLSAGIRAFSGSTRRKQLGTGTSGSDYDLSLNSDYRRNLHYLTTNFALYAEQLFRVSNQFSISPGFRLEQIGNQRSGRFGTLAESQMPAESLNRFLFLPGITASWKMLPALELYGNYSGAYRPVTYAEQTPLATTESVDPALKDSKGYNAEIGMRGSAAFFNYDLTAFFLSVQNRIGLLGNVRTNIGDSESKGLEAFAEFCPLRLSGTRNSNAPDFSVFVTATWMKAMYKSWKDDSPGKNLSGKKVEYAPDLSLRSGLQFSYRRFSFSGTWNFQTAVYADALNTETPSANAQAGKLPAFQLFDASATLNLFANHQLKLGVNNLLDARYATRRAGGYPGPGLLPGQARNFYASFSVNF